MNSTLKITWQGDVPGLAEHRVSLEHFGSAINLLLVAYRRIASNMLRDAVEGEKLADKRLRKAAKWLDLQVAEITDGSAGLVIAGVVSPPVGGQLPLFDSLTARAGGALLDAIEAESKGDLRSSAVRKYLKALPFGLQGQLYEFRSNGFSRDVKLDSFELAELPQSAPHFLEVEGYLVSVGFEPGRPFVVVALEDGKSVKFSATEEQVEGALELRSSPVTVFSVRRKNENRLLNLWASDNPPKPLTDEERHEAVFGKWDGLLRRLAQ